MEFYKKKSLKKEKQRDELSLLKFLARLKLLKWPIPEKNKCFLKFGFHFWVDQSFIQVNCAQVSNLASFLEDLRQSEKLWDKPPLTSTFP